MNIRTWTVSLALAAGSLLFVAQPALQAQDYYTGGRYQDYYNDGRYNDGRYNAPRYDRYASREQRKIDHERDEMDRALYRGDYRAARKEAREIEQLRWKAERDRSRRYREYRGRDDRDWNR